MTSDLRYGLRQLRGNPVFTVVAIVTLALGIGANTAIFSVTNAILMRYLPVRDPHQLVNLHTTDFTTLGGQSGYGDTSLTERIFEQLRAEKRAFSDLVAYAPLSFGKVGVRYGAEPEEANVDLVSGNFFSGLGVSPFIGRTFTMEDETSRTLNAVLSYGYWTARLAGNPSVLGQVIYLKGVPFTIVGVAAPRFIGLEHGTPTDLWIPLQTRPDFKAWGNSADDSSQVYNTPTWWYLLMTGRLAPGVSEQQALAILNPQFQRAAYTGSSGPGPNEKPPQLSFSSARGIEGLRDQYEQPLSVLLGMVGLVLIIACGNVAMLLTARNAARQREFSLRMALGGSQADLFQQLLTESLLLVVGAGALGWLFAVWATRALAAWSNLELSLTPDLTVLFFTLGVSLLTAFVFGLVPLFSVIRIPIWLVLKTSAATANRDNRKQRAGKLVIALQMSLCLMLLVGAGLLTRTLQNLESANLGLRASGLLVFGVSPQQNVRTDSELVRFFDPLLVRLRGLPGVESATLSSNRVGGGVSNNTTAYVDGLKPAVSGFPSMRWNAVGPEFFRVLGTPLVAGRDFTAADSASSAKVAIVNQTFASRYLPHLDPLGHRVAFSGGAGDTQYTIVGLAFDSRYTSVREKQRPMAYFPYSQVPGLGSTMHFDLRTAGNPAALLPQVQRVLREFAPDLPLLQPMTQQEQFDRTVSQDRLVARLALFFGLLAALLVATGLYGTLAYRVTRRTSEIGVRMALGAQRSQVLWMVLRESLAVALVGVAIGLPLAFAGARLLGSMLYNLTPSDPVTFVAALVGITLVALAASFIPARRASSIDPILALRNE